MLRLPDVGRGYVVGDDSGCGGLGTENAPPSVAQVAVTYFPVYECSMEFERLWRPRRPTPTRGALYVSSAAYVFGSDEGVHAGFAAGRELLAYELGLQAKDLVARDRPLLGEEASLFFIPHAFAPGRTDRPGSAVLWRRGRVLGITYVFGFPEPKAGRVTLSLARRQDERIEKPTPLSPGVNDDREVRLDNPELRIRVYWLGLRFGPRRGLPALRLAYVDGPLHGDELGYRASVQYEGSRDGVVLDLWKPRRWQRFRRSKRGHGFWDRPCARKRTVQLPRGRADLFRSCARRHARYVAHVHLPRLLVAVYPYCIRCEAGDGAYGSFKGLSAITRGLRARHPRR